MKTESNFTYQPTATTVHFRETEERLGKEVKRLTNENKIVEDENREIRKKISEARSKLAASEPQIFEFPEPPNHNQTNLGGIYISYIFDVLFFKTFLKCLWYLL